MKNSQDRKMKIAGIGCCLLDYIYTDVDFSKIDQEKYFSNKQGDGGLLPGKLVFSEDLEIYTGENIASIASNILNDQKPDATNIGGPGIVALIHASQMLYDRDISFSFYGYCGDDSAGKELRSMLDKTSIDSSHYHTVEGNTPRTLVLSDPDYDNGQGERLFINTVGVAGKYLPVSINESFFESDILLFGGTALVPGIHDNLSELLEKGKEHTCVNIVTTVFDFRNESRNPGKPWPLGHSDVSFELIDLLIMDEEEALRISGKATCIEASTFFQMTNVKAFIITRGPEEIIFYSGGGLFQEHQLANMPVLSMQDYRTNSKPSDTTGCGDNFAGGVLSSIASQLEYIEPGEIDIKEACSWGIVSGTYTGLIAGGVEFETRPGEKYHKVKKLYDEYKKLNFRD